MSAKPTAIPGEREEFRPRLGWGIVAGALAIWAFAVLAVHLKDLGIKEPFRILGNLYDLDRYGGVESAGALASLWAGHAWHLAAAGWMAVAAFGLGTTALDLLRLGYPGPALRPLLGLGLGYALLGLLMLGGGLVGMWYAFWPAAFMTAGSAAAWRHRARGRALLPPPAGSPAMLVAKAVALAAAGLVVFVSLAPEVFYDSLVYHLADPENWAKDHKVTFMPYNFFSNFPFTFEMLFAVGVLFGNDAIARLAHAGVSLAAAGLMGWMAAWLAAVADPRSARGEGRTTAPGVVSGAGWLAAAIFLTTPLIVNSAWMTGIDAGLVFYEGALVLGVMLWWEAPRPRGKTPAAESHWLWLAAAFGGLGMGVKYTVGLAVALLGFGVAFRVAAPSSREALRAWVAAVLATLAPFTLSHVREIQGALTGTARTAFAVTVGLALACGVAWLVRRWSVRRSARGIVTGLLFGMAVTAAVAPWNLKSWLYTRNPVFPFAYAAIDSFHVSPERMEYQMGEFEEGAGRRPFKEWLTHPWHVTRISGFSNNSACGALFLSLLPLLVAFRGVDARIKLLGIVLLGRYLVWANLSNIVRYFAPGLGLLGVLGAVAVERFGEGRAVRWVGRVAVAAFTAVNLYNILLVGQGSVGFAGVVLGIERPRDFFLRDRSSYPCPPYAAAEAMNAGLPRGAEVLYVGEARGAFYRDRVTASTVFDFPVLVELCGASATPAEVTKRLRQLGVTHVYFNACEAQRIGGYGIFAWPDERSRELFGRWWAGRLDLLWRAGWHEVYALIPGGVDRRTAPLHFAHERYETYKQAVELEQRAMSGVQQGRLEDAERAARALVELVPGAARAHEALGQVLAFRNRNREALASLRRAERLGMRSDQVLFNQSVVLRRLGRHEEADRAYRESEALKRAWEAFRKG